MNGVQRLLLMGVPGSGGGSYLDRIRSIQPLSLLSYLPLSETGGTVAADLSGNNRVGAYATGATPGGDTWINGEPAPALGVKWINWYSDSLRDALTPNTWTVMAWIKINQVASPAAIRYPLQLYPGADYLNWTVRANNALVFDYTATAQRRIDLMGAAQFGVWLQIATVINHAGNAISFYLNGELVRTQTSPGVFDIPLVSTTTLLGAGNTTGLGPLEGSIKHVALWSTPLNAAEIRSSYQAIRTISDMMVIGDSKSTQLISWHWGLRSQLLKASGITYHNSPVGYGIAGATVATAKTYIDANLAAATGNPGAILINLGANDVGSLPAEATWKANLTSILNSLRAKWPVAQIYIALPWRRDYETECNSLATWIADVIATYVSGVAIGIDERVVVEGGDDGATNTTDGTHYTDAGNIAVANAWYDLLT